MSQKIDPNSVCEICGLRFARHSMPHPFQPQVTQRAVNPILLRATPLPQTNYLLVDANPCSVCGMVPKNHHGNHNYQNTYQPPGLPGVGHNKYVPQKEVNVASESYYHGYELLMESKNQIPVEDPTRRPVQNLTQHFPGHPHDHRVGQPGSANPISNQMGIAGYSANPRHSSTF